MTEAQAAADLAGSRVDINGDGAHDLIVQGTGGCFIGAHSTNFYVLSKAETRIAPGRFVAFRAGRLSPGKEHIDRRPQGH